MQSANVQDRLIDRFNLKQEYEIVGDELGDDAKPLLDLGMCHAVEHQFISE